MKVSRPGASFSMSNILSDPFTLSTLSICTIGWILALIGSITASRNLSKFPVFTWWGLSCEFLIILIIFYVTGTNNMNPYRLGILAALAMTTVYTTNSTNNFVYLTTPSTAAAAAGYMLLSIINIIWMFYYGTTDEVKLHALIDSYSGNKPSPSYASAGQQLDSVARQSNPFMHSSDTRNYNSGQLGNPSQGVNSNNGIQSDSAAYPQMFMAAPLGAFENSSGINHKEGNFRQSRASMTTTSEVPPTPTEYPYRAKAVYSYTANPSDANEISFEKGEILEVSDISGKWWQARRANGQVGICPSNYVVLQKDI